MVCTWSRGVERAPKEAAHGLARNALAGDIGSSSDDHLELIRFATFGPAAPPLRATSGDESGDSSGELDAVDARPGLQGRGGTSVSSEGGYTT